MKSRVFLIFFIFFLLAVGENTWGQGFYKWVDEKGNVHFSDDPPPVSQKSQAKKEDKSQAKTQEKNQIKGQDKNQDRKAAKEDSLAILKGLEIGNRRIPEDMKKYGPSGPEPQRPQDQGQASSSSSTRRGAS